MRTGPRKALALSVACALGAAGCSMPRPIASVSEVESAGKAGSIQLVKASAATIPPIPASPGFGFPPEFVSAPEAQVDRLGPGDRINVRVWESGTPTVFTSAGGGTDLGEIAVDESGRIYLPYVGAVRAAGLTVAELRSAVTGRLRTVVLHPQVDIRKVEQKSALVTVQGKATKTGSFPIERGRTRLGQILAEVAPDQDNARTLNVILRRDGTSGTVRLSDIYAEPSLDVALQPGDSIILQEDAQTVTVLGAAGVQGQVEITKRNFTLVDALGAARGLDGESANPSGVFLMRLGPTADSPATVYQYDLRRPDELALAARTVLRDGDSIMISSSSFAQVRYILAAFAQSLGAVRSAASIP